jgi:hypothetical protein
VFVKLGGGVLASIELTETVKNETARSHGLMLHRKRADKRSEDMSLEMRTLD